jgi:hypothetical protein
MFLLNFFDGAELMGVYLVGAEVGAFWLAMFCWGALLLSLPYLANIKQPVPSWATPRNHHRKARR